eukprot:266985_1
MDDFLGTSIQYAEQQIKLLEKEYAIQQEQIVQQLIESGFLDSDYESETEEPTDYESETDIQDDIDNTIANSLSNNSESDTSVESIENIMNRNDGNNTYIHCNHIAFDEQCTKKFKVKSKTNRSFEGRHKAHKRIIIDENSNKYGYSQGEIIGNGSGQQIFQYLLTLLIYLNNKKQNGKIKLQNKIIINVNCSMYGYGFLCRTEIGKQNIRVIASKS